MLEFTVEETPISPSMSSKRQTFLDPRGVLMFGRRQQDHSSAREVIKEGGLQAERKMCQPKRTRSNLVTPRTETADEMQLEKLIKQDNGNRGLGQTYSVFSANSANTVQRDDAAILFKTVVAMWKYVISWCKVSMNETLRLHLNIDKNTQLAVDDSFLCCYYLIRLCINVLLHIPGSVKVSGRRHQLWLSSNRSIPTTSSMDIIP
ncbi:52_t:CDS:2 [Paraglomus occultum]|uniref:52_t:CDS:1 n=1 Tax=Paraglomus occultum TaxID=144539 RepID=A0A9N9AXV2_9GLOM|nr:52_t:CDS:2 [Paraglomus occultum]